MDFGLLSCVFSAVATLTLTGIPGFAAGFFGIIDDTFLQVLSRFQLAFLTPALIVSTLGARFSYERMEIVWPLMIWSCLQLGVAFGVASTVLVISRYTRCEWQGSKSLVAILQVAICFQNIGAFNIPLLQTLCSVKGLFPTHGEHCFEDGIVMILGYHVPWDLAFWTWGYIKLSTLKDSCTKGGRAKYVEPLPENSQHVQKSDMDSESLEIHQLPLSEKTGCSEVEELKSLVAVLPPYVKLIVKKVLLLLQRASHFFNPLFAALLIGIVVGLTPTLRSSLFGKTSHLSPVGDALKRVGAVAPIMVTQILTGTLGITAKQMLGFTNEGLFNSSRCTFPLTWLLAVVSGKLILVPLASSAIFELICNIQKQSQLPSLPHARANLAPTTGTEVFISWLVNALWPADSLFRAVIVMQFSAPSCINIIVLCHRVGLQEGIVRAVSMLYLTMYAVTMFTSTMWVSSGLKLFLRL